MHRLLRQKLKRSQLLVYSSRTKTNASTIKDASCVVLYVEFHYGKLLSQGTNKVL